MGVGVGVCRGRHRAACTGVRVVLLVRRGDASQAQCAQASILLGRGGGEGGGRCGQAEWEAAGQLGGQRS